MIFVSRKTYADKLAELLEFVGQISVIHASKEQNHRTRSIDNFESGASRILIATDVIARGIDIDNISTVISFDTPFYPENYIHRIGRTGRAGAKGQSILFYSEKEKEQKAAIEELMNYEIPEIDFPAEVEISSELTDEEKPKEDNPYKELKQQTEMAKGLSFHKKKDKNNIELLQEKSQFKKKKRKFKKPIRRGDKIQNLKKKKRKH